MRCPFHQTLTHGKKLIVRFHYIFHGCSNKTLRFPRINITHTHLWQNSGKIALIHHQFTFLTSKQPFVEYFFLVSCNVCLLAIPEIFAQTQGSDYWQLIHWHIMTSILKSQNSVASHKFFFSLYKCLLIQYIEPVCKQLQKWYLIFLQLDFFTQAFKFD